MLYSRLFAKPPLLAMSALLVSLAVCPSTHAAEVGRALRAARYEMIEAKAELKAEHFSRIRKETIEALDAAIAETERALKAAKIEHQYEPPKYKFENHPHLRQAILDLQEAKKELKEERFGPEREKGIKELDRAIEHLEEAVKLIK
jgi:hypothetical protein